MFLVIKTVSAWGQLCIWREGEGTVKTLSKFFFFICCVAPKECFNSLSSLFWKVEA